MPNTKMMKCGHSDNGEQILPNGDKIPYCCICDCNEVVDTPEISGRKAKCECGKIVESSIELPFFSLQPDREFDSYYCGCWGWD